MKKIFTKTVMLCLFLFFGGGITYAQTTPFMIEESFDDPTHFSDGATVPDGWKSEGSYFPFSRNKGEDVGVPPYSGSYVLATISNTASSTRDEAVYTPMMKLAAGKECKISFYVYAPGGTPAAVRNNQVKVAVCSAQSADAKVADAGESEKKAFSEWTPLSFSFTPEADGEYCFAISLYTSMSSCGQVGFDDFLITGESPKETVVPDTPLVPNPANEAEAVELPYSESFDNENDNYDGTTYVPAKWFSTGTIPFTTLSTSNLPARTGDYYLYTSSSVDLRDERIYTPFFVLTAGKEYTISAYVYMEQGTLMNDKGEIGNTTMDITVGTQQESDFHKSLLKLESYSNEGWELQEVKFTPETTGAYCFSYALSSETSYAGMVAIDDFLITADGLVLKPQANFGNEGIYDISTSELVVYKDQVVKMNNLSKNATSYEWSVVDNDKVEISDPTAENPEFKFLASGTYTVKLTAKNSTGERSTFKEFNVEYIDGDKTNYGVGPAGPDDTFYSRYTLPSVDPDSELEADFYDFITGPNKYYRKIAERLQFPEETEVTFNSLTVVLTNLHYKIKNNSREEQLNAKIDVVLYGETDGKIDETKEFGRYSKTLEETFGSSGIGAGYGDMRSIQFENPIKVKGNCYLAIEYDDVVDIVEEDANIGRTNIGLQAVKHSSGITTLMVKPTKLPETATAKIGEWGYVDQIVSDYKGFGLWFVAWIDSKSEQGSVAVNSFGETVFAVRTINNGIEVSGTQKGETVYVYGMDGTVAAAAVATRESAFIPVPDAAKGLYIVKAKAGVKKIAIR